MLQNHLESKKLILASGSSRRQELLTNLGVPFEIRIKPVEEIYAETLQREEITDFLSQLKASVFKADLTANCILITSDTIVWFKNKALGKPKSLKQACDMLKRLSGSTHEVITSVSLSSTKKQITFNAKTYVTFRELKAVEIEFYIKNYNPLDRAGAYGIQDWIGQIGIQKIHGCYFNVMGFPLNLVYSHLVKF